MSLASRTLLLPRTAAADRLAQAARDAGAHVVLTELIRHETVDPPGELDAALRAAASYEWLALTSATTVAVLAERAAVLGVPLAELMAGPRVAVVGPATGAAAAAHGLTPDLRPPGPYTALDLLAVWPRGQGRVLLPCSEIAAPTLADGLRERGRQVDVVVAYRTLLATTPDPAVSELVRAAGVDVVVLTSSSTAEAFARLYGAAPGTRFCAIGASTAGAARRAGLTVDAVADHQTTTGLLAAARRALTAEGNA